MSGEHLKLSQPPRSPRLPRCDAREHPSKRQLGAPASFCAQGCPQLSRAPGRYPETGAPRTCLPNTTTTTTLIGAVYVCECACILWPDGAGTVHSVIMVNDFQSSLVWLCGLV